MSEDNNIIDITAILKATAALKEMPQPQISDDIDALNLEVYIRRGEVVSLRMCCETLVEFLSRLRQQMEDEHHYEEMHKATKIIRQVRIVLGMLTPITGESYV